VNSLGCSITVLRDTIFAIGREHAANNAGLRFGTGHILGFAVSGLWRRFRSKRVSLAQTALRLYPRRRAICAALCPAAQSFFEQCYVFRIPTHRRYYTPIANYRLVDTRIAKSINPG
jgi:hypothetical protein